VSGVKVEIPSWGRVLRDLLIPLAAFLWFLVALVLAGPVLDDIGRDLQRNAVGDFPEGIADVVRGLGIGHAYPAALWVLVPLAILATIGAAFARRRESPVE